MAFSNAIECLLLYKSTINALKFHAHFLIYLTFMKKPPTLDDSLSFELFNFWGNIRTKLAC